MTAKKSRECRNVEKKVVENIENFDRKHETCLKIFSWKLDIIRSKNLIEILKITHIVENIENIENDKTRVHVGSN
jgi:hypothetical protein